MDNIGQQHDILKRDIDEQHINETLLSQIDRWGKESIKKIRSNKLRSNRENNDYTESDLDQWINQLKHLQKKLKKPSTIEIVEDNLSSFYLIKIKKTSVVENEVVNLMQQSIMHSGERFNKAIGPVVLSEDGCSATCIANLESLHSSTPYSSVCGRLQYSCDIHYLRFRLNTSCSSAVFIGIITSSETIIDESSALKSVYGYWSSGKPVMAGSTKIYREIQTQPNDEVFLILNCSSRKISYVHERTEQHREMNIEHTICPFPWKLVVTLWYPNDKIEILNL
jgi:hypothetical protein